MCTIIAKNYLAHARVLTRSFRKHNPDTEVFVLVVDQFDGYIALDDEPFTLIRMEELSLDDRASLCFKYSVLELCTAVKPFLLAHLFDHFRIERLMYLDPDILVLDSLSPLYDRLSSHSIVLTPHITDPIDDAALPDERTFLQCGVYNLGFVAVADTPTTRRMLTWWQQRCYEHCTVRLEDGLFVDQKWMDLVPALFGSVSVVTEPGYNVAYWNLHGREIRHTGSGWTVNGEPLRFFHFSGYDPTIPHSISKHQTRWALRDLGVAERLFDAYQRLLLDAGYREVIRWPYSFSTFDNGVAISPIIRDLYYRLGPPRRQFGDPFVTAGPDSLFGWLNAAAMDEQPTSPYISNLIAHIVNFRKDIKESYPDFRGRQRRVFINWLRSVGSSQLNLDPRFLEPLAGEQWPGEASLFEAARAFSRESCKVCPLVAALDRYGFGWKVRALTQQFFRRRASAVTASAPRGAVTAPGVAQRANRVPAPSDTPRQALLVRLAGRVIEKTLRPCARHHVLKNLIVRNGAMPPGLSAVPAIRTEAQPDESGINVVGYFSTESGVGEAARLMSRAIRAAGLPHALLNVDISYNLRRADRTITEFSTSNPYAINLIHVNADQLPVVAQHYGPDFFARRTNIGFWMWELSEFPREWEDRFARFDEVWAPSLFTAEAIARIAPIPVSTVPLPVVEQERCPVGREYFGLSEGVFIFLFIFDFASVFQRKNPMAVIEAFRRAFRPGDRALLVLKFSNAEHDPRNAERLRRAAHHAGVRLIEGYLSRGEVSSLTSACDAYVSLHRSEGFGLTMAEAMLAGKPVIATNYSGNLQFMNPANSFLVNFRLEEVAEAYGPYRPGSRWAEPDVEHAAALMRRVFGDRDAAAEVAEAGRRTIKEAFSPEAVAKIVAAELDRVRDRHHRKTAELALEQRPTRTALPRPLIRRIANALARVRRPVVSRNVMGVPAEIKKAQATSRTTLAEEVAALRAHLESEQQDLASLRSDVDRLTRHLLATPYINRNLPQAQPRHDTGQEFDYVGFQDRFRGPGRMLEEHFRYYVPYVREMPPVLDLGCGRGEFLSVLRDVGVEACGVEIHEGQAEESRRRGLDVVQADLFEYLASVADDSIGCAFSAQVIEHIPFEQVCALFRLCYRKLKPGGLLIAETVNPHSMAAFKFFWLDPTHIAPLFPETMQFLAESVGFHEASIVYPVPHGDPRRLYHDCGEYALVARKPWSTASRPSEDADSAPIPEGMQ